MPTTIHNITDFFYALDELKLVNRKSYVTGAERVENSAEHSWHLAMACWTMAEHLPYDYDQEKLIKLALVHDLGEIYAGDTFLYSDKRQQADEEERKGIELLQAHIGNPISELLTLWDEQEYGESEETKLLKVMDRILPFLLNVQSQGKAWLENDVHVSQVEKSHAFIADINPDVHAWFKEKIALAVSKGWLKV
jgi:putative hydrolase of HD superfamily